eukprot:scaffold7635_cov131-Skeletonema_marinoi.AAC.11
MCGGEKVSCNIPVGRQCFPSRKNATPLLRGVAFMYCPYCRGHNTTASSHEHAWIFMLSSSLPPR